MENKPHRVPLELEKPLPLSDAVPPAFSANAPNTPAQTVGTESPVDTALLEEQI